MPCSYRIRGRARRVPRYSEGGDLVTYLLNAWIYRVDKSLISPNEVQLISSEKMRELIQLYFGVLEDYRYAYLLHNIVDFFVFEGSDQEIIDYIQKRHEERTASQCVMFVNKFVDPESQLGIYLDKIAKFRGIVIFVKR